MSTQVGNTIKSLGKEYNIASSNVGGDKILNSNYLKENTLIIDAKVDNNLYDVGSYSLFITDGEGKAARLTYTIQPGNGLYNDPADTDIVRMYIEGNSIKSEEGTGLYVDTPNIIDNDTIQIYTDDDISYRPNTGRFRVVTANLDKADDTRWGIVRPDENTTYIADLNPDDEDFDDLRLMVNTQNLETVDDAANRDGIVKHNSEMARTIEAKDGSLNVITANLQHADDSDDIYGIAKGDELTIDAKSGILSVNTQGLDHASNEIYGTVKLDENTIKYDKDKDNIYVEAKNLAAATKDEAGVVRYDDWSIGVALDGRIEVKRFQELEAILESNPTEHAEIKEALTLLDGRVAKLEAEANAEKIEFLTPIGDILTNLPEPIFDTDTWSIKNRYSEKKTIAFQIKTNCKYKLNYEFEENTNKYGQVQLLNLQVGDDELIPANSIEETTFKETGKTVQTLYFTFTVSNYEADDNVAFTNTNIKFTATSINDDAIYQKSLHIFKCWNNKAYELDMPNFDSVDSSAVNLASYWFVHPESRYLQVSETTDAEWTSYVDYGKTSSKNFFFNTYICGTYISNASAESTGIENVLINQSISENNLVSTDDNNYTNIRYEIEVNDADNTVTSNDFTVSIASTYNSTQKYNVIKVESLKPLEESFRTVSVKLYPNGIGSKPIKLDNTDTISNATISAGDPINRYIQLVKLINTDQRLENKTITSILNNIDKEYTNTFINDELLIDALTHPSSTDTTSIYERQLAKRWQYGGKRDTMGVHKSIENNYVSNIIKNDILAVNTLCMNFTDFIKDNDLKKKNPEYITDKATYTAYWTYTNSINSYVDNILSRIQNTRTAVNEMIDEIPSAETNYIEFKYTESINAPAPTINLDFNVSDNGISYVMSRNAGSLYDKGGQLTIQYVFTNKKGDNVDADGKPFTGNNYYNFNIPVVSNSTTYKGKYTPDFFNSAATGYSNSTTDKVTYFNVFVMNGGVEDRGSVFGVGKKDLGWCKWSGYDSTNNKSISSITDNVYVLFRLKGQDAGSQGYYTLNWKGKSSGDDDEIARSNWLCWEGLAKDSCWNSGSATVYSNIKIGNNYYMTREYAINQIKTKNSANIDDKSNYELAKLYYDTFKSSLVYTTTKVAVKVANGVTGMKILDIDTTLAPDYKDRLPGVTYKISGIWNYSGVSNNVNNDKPYTFGDAYISEMSIEPWDDFEMTIKFTITGGDATNIPDGTEFSELKQSNNGSTKFTLLVGSSSYLDTYFYDSKTVTYEPWKNNHCVVTYKLYNDYSLNKEGIYMYKTTTMYDKNTKSRKTVYLKTDTKAHTETNTIFAKIMSLLAPNVVNISGIKAWFGIQGKSTSLQMNFESSTSSNGQEIKFNSISFSNGITKSTSVLNALYNSTITVTTTPAATKTTSLSSILPKNKEKSVTITTTKLSNNTAATRNIELQK